MKFVRALAQEPTIFLSRKLWHFAAGRRWQIVLYMCMFLTANLIMLLPPLLFGEFIRTVQEQGVVTANFQYLLLLLLYLFLVEVVFWAFHGPARVIERSVAFWVEVNYRRHLLSGVLDLGLSWHSEHDSGDTIDKVNKAGDGMLKFGENIFQIMQLLVKLFGTAIILMWFSPTIGIVVLVLVLLSFVVIFQFDRYLVPQYRRLNEFGNRSMASIFDALSNITSVKILRIESPVIEGVMARLKAPYTLYQDNSKLNEGKWFVGGVLFQIIAIGPIAFYLYQALSRGQAVDAGTISTLYLYLTSLVFVYWGFTDFYQTLVINKNRVLNAQPIEDAFMQRSQVRREKSRHWNTLNITDLRFSYSDGGVSDLDGVSMQIHRGERIAVIGESGSGKTTFLKVLHGLYPSAQAQVSLDGSPSFSASFADLDLKTMLVPQEPEIFSSTIRENITLGIAYEEEDVIQATRVANFEKVVQGLPRGLDSVINEKGVNLSGGQKQRLALSRALLFAKEKDLILLDESTSSVDPENETDIYTNIWKSFTGKTVVASIHKMNLLKLFDRIYIFEKGRIADSGSFDELFERNASFRDAWNQFVATERGAAADA